MQQNRKSARPTLNCALALPRWRLKFVAAETGQVSHIAKDPTVGWGTLLLSARGSASWHGGLREQRSWRPRDRSQLRSVCTSVSADSWCPPEDLLEDSVARHFADHGTSWRCGSRLQRLRKLVSRMTFASRFYAWCEEASLKIPFGKWPQSINWKIIFCSASSKVEGPFEWKRPGSHRTMLSHHPHDGHWLVLLLLGMQNAHPDLHHNTIERTHFNGQLQNEGIKEH